MKLKNLILFLGILCLCILNNTSLFAQYQLTPECNVEFDGNRYIIHFTLPDYIITEDTICDEIFSSVEFIGNVDYDVTDEAGYPALPFFSLDLLIPECVTDVLGFMEEESIFPEELDYFIQPAMLGSRITESGEYINLDEECWNWEYYTAGATEEYPDGYCMEYYSMSDIYTFLGTKGITVAIHPFRYHLEGHMDVLREATIVIEFNCGNIHEAINELQAQGTYSSYISQLYYDTFGGEIAVENNSGENGRYLIVAASRAFETYLSPYVNYKREQNYFTEVVYLDELDLLGDSIGIKAYIDNNTVVSNPDFVLLVGNLSDIPPFEGENSTSNPYSDDGYHDFVGRWIIDEPDYNGIYTDLLRVVDKTMNTEIDYVDTYSTAALFSGTDNSRIMSRSLYRNIEKVAASSFAPMGIPYTLYDGRNYERDQALGYIIPVLEGNTRFFMYTGHGNQYGIGQPYSLSYNDLPICSSPYPIGFGFACSMNSYTTNSSFAARWVTGPYGGVAFLGSTITTFLSPDNSFAKRIFKELKKLTNKTSNFPLSTWLRISEKKYYSALMGPVRGRQVRKYNLIGDPTIAVYGMDYLGGYAPFHMPPQNRDNQESISTISQISLIEIYDIWGKKITSSSGEDGQLTEGSLSSGVYVVKTIHTDGLITTYKLIK